VAIWLAASPAAFAPPPNNVDDITPPPRELANPTAPPTADALATEEKLAFSFVNSSVAPPITAPINVAPICIPNSPSGSVYL